MQANVSPKKVQRVGLDPVMSVSVVIQDPPFSMVDPVMRQRSLSTARLIEADRYSASDPAAQLGWRNAKREAAHPHLKLSDSDICPAIEDKPTDESTFSRG